MLNAAEFLSQSGFFKDFSETSRQRLAQGASVVDRPKRSTLFREGEAGTDIYILASGRVRLHRTTGEGREVVIKVVRPGELFAETILFERPDYPVTATALSDTLLLKIARSQVQELLKDADFRNDFIAGLMSKLRFLTSRIVELTTDDVAERLLGFLREQLGESTRGELPMTKQDVASAIGTTPETLSRTLQRLSKQGVLTWQGRMIHLEPASPDTGP